MYSSWWLFLLSVVLAFVSASLVGGAGDEEVSNRTNDDDVCDLETLRKVKKLIAENEMFSSTSKRVNILTNLRHDQGKLVERCLFSAKPFEDKANETTSLLVSSVLSSYEGIESNIESNRERVGLIKKLVELRDLTDSKQCERDPIRRLDALAEQIKTDGWYPNFIACVDEAKCHVCQVCFGLDNDPYRTLGFLQDFERCATQTSTPNSELTKQLIAASEFNSEQCKDRAYLDLFATLIENSPFALFGGYIRFFQMGYAKFCDNVVWFTSENQAFPTKTDTQNDRLLQTNNVAPLTPDRTLELLVDAKCGHQEVSFDLIGGRRHLYSEKLIAVSQLVTNGCEFGKIEKAFRRLIRTNGPESNPNIITYLQFQLGKHARKCLFGEFQDGLLDYTCEYLESTLVYHEYSHTFRASIQQYETEEIFLVKKLVEYCGFVPSKCESISPQSMEELSERTSNYYNLHIFLIERESVVSELCILTSECTLQPQKMLDFLNLHQRHPEADSKIPLSTVSHLISLSILEERNCESDQYKSMFEGTQLLIRQFATLNLRDYIEDTRKNYNRFCASLRDRAGNRPESNRAVEALGQAVLIRRQSSQQVRTQAQSRNSLISSAYFRLDRSQPLSGGAQAPTRRPSRGSRTKDWMQKLNCCKPQARE